MTHTADPPLRSSLDDEELARRRRRAQGRRRAARWLKRGLLAAAALGGVAALARAWMPQPVTVDVALARRADLQVFVEEEGRTRVHTRHLVLAPVGGELRRLTLEAGDRVGEGQVLARIAPPEPAILDGRMRSEAEARLAMARSRAGQAATAAARARAARDLAAREAARTRALVPQALPEAERDRADLAERTAAEELAAAELGRTVAAAEMRAAQLALAGPAPGAAREVMVRAPAAGSVLRVARESEGLVAPGAPLLEIGDPADLEVVVDVLSADAARLSAGAPAWIERWGGEAALRGRVRRVEPSGFTRLSALGVEEQRVNVLVSLEQRPPELGDGFRVEVRLLAWEGKGVQTVPASAVFREAAGWAVYTVEDGRARLRAVTVGRRGRLDFEIGAGLEDGAPVIIYPGERVRDGVPVVPRQDPAKAEPGA